MYLGKGLLYVCFDVYLLIAFNPLRAIHTPLPSYSLTSQGDFVIESQPVPSHPTWRCLVARTFDSARGSAAEMSQERFEAGQAG